MTTKKATTHPTDDLRSEYDISKLTGGVRGKYFDRATAGKTLVLLDPDVAKAFPDGKTVNEALRALLKVAQALPGASGRGGKLSGKPPTSIQAKRREKKRKLSRAARG